MYWAETDRMTRRPTGTTATSRRTPADPADLALGESVRTSGGTSISHLFARIAEREAELACQADALRVEIDQLTARLNNIERDLEHVQITRTATSLADGLDQDGSVPGKAGTARAPLYPQLLAVFHEKQRPLRARDLRGALALGLLPKSVEGVRSKLTRLVARGSSPRPNPECSPRTGRRTSSASATSTPHPTQLTTGTGSRAAF
ncbi:hypothetical protein [Streptomyces scopuliridis]|uniref:hypothetical protein n=1 Tax=Streptomyces scopuliridis TaxID=452529 RepID=UPI003424F883